MKKLVFTVTVYLQDEIKPTANDLIDFNENIGKAIEDGANGRGITPEKLDTFTRAIEVKCEGNPKGGEYYKEL